MSLSAKRVIEYNAASPSQYSTGDHKRLDESENTPLALEAVLQGLGFDPKQNLSLLINFGTRYLNCRQISYRKLSDFNEDEPLPEGSKIFHLKEDKKVLVLHRLRKGLDKSRFAVFKNLLHREEVRFRDHVKIDGLREYTKTLFEACPDGLLITDPFGQVVNTNGAMSAITRRPMKSLIGLNVKKLLGSNGRAELFKAIRRLRVQHRASFNCRIRVGAGRTIPVSVAFRDFNFQNQALVLATVRDLSEMEQHLHRSTHYENSLSRSIENANDVFIRCDQFGRIEEGNPMVEKLTGVSASRLQGRSVDELFDTSCMKVFRKALAELHEHGYSSFSAKALRLNQDSVDVRVTLMNFEREGEPCFRVFIQSLALMRPFSSEQ